MRSACSTIVSAEPFALGADQQGSARAAPRARPACAARGGRSPNLGEGRPTPATSAIVVPGKFLMPGRARARRPGREHRAHARPDRLWAERVRGAGADRDADGPERLGRAQDRADVARDRGRRGGRRTAGRWASAPSAPRRRPASAFPKPARRPMPAASGRPRSPGRPLPPRRSVQSAASRLRRRRRADPRPRRRTGRPLALTVAHPELADLLELLVV